MIVSRVSAFLAFGALLFAADAAVGQREVTGPPRQLQPDSPEAPIPDPDVPSEPDTPGAAGGYEHVPVAPATNAIVPPKPSIMGSSGASAVEVSALGGVEGAPAGLIDDASGGLGYAMWQGTDRATAEDLLLRVPAETRSPAARALLRRVLLTAAAAPQGAARMGMGGLRLEKLLEGGFVEDAAGLAALLQARNDAAFARAQADALLLGGRDEDACGPATEFRFRSAEPFWIELRAYCYALSGDRAALDLTRAVMDAQSLDDPAFAVLLEGVPTGKAKDPGEIAAPSTLHIRLLDRFGLPMNEAIATGLSVSASLIAARSTATAKELRLAAAEKALRAGALPNDLLASVLDLEKFPDDRLQAAGAQAAAMPLLPALALLRQALAKETGPGPRGELVHAAFRLADREGLLAQVAKFFSNEAANVRPLEEWDAWSPLMSRGLILAERPDAAVFWYDILDYNAPADAPTINAIQLSLALAAPNEARTLQSQGALLWIARESAKSAPAGGIATVRRAAMELSFFDALGRQMPTEALLRASQFAATDLPGRQAAPLMLRRIGNAALGGRLAETALTALAAMGPAGPERLAPVAATAIVRALVQVGLEDAAQAIAVEAALSPLQADAG